MSTPIQPASQPTQTTLATQPTLSTIAEQLRQISTRLDSVDKHFDALDNRFDALNKRFDALDKRFNALDNRFDALSNQMFIGQAELVLHLHRTRRTVVDLEQNMYRRHQNSNITNPVVGLFVPLRATGGEVDLGNGRWGAGRPGVTRQSIEDATDDEIDDLLQRIGVRGNLTIMSNKRFSLPTQSKIALKFRKSKANSMIEPSSVRSSVSDANTLVNTPIERGRGHRASKMMKISAEDLLDEEDQAWGGPQCRIPFSCLFSHLIAKGGVRCWFSSN
ncbi:hypothetical protein F5887DRAFT_1282068 [Amanita rubescens]|nr:hypothetical protein F5887DRAFT_1282068 [Amanita rubescens]